MFQKFVGRAHWHCKLLISELYIFSPSWGSNVKDKIWVFGAMSVLLEGIGKRKKKLILSGMYDFMGKVITGNTKVGK